ncbi:MAG: phosphonate ABC transporter substrate-binding protein [Hyphomicrobiaceae bacterium]
MMKRCLLVAAAACLALTATAAVAQDWKAKYPELVLAIVPAENASGVTNRFQPFVDYLSKEIGTKVTLRIANDYAAVIEGHKAGNIHIGYHGPSSYVRAWTVTNGGVEPFVTTINSDGSVGYYSVAYAKATAPGKTLEDFKGKNLCLVDPNSTSGGNLPRFAMSKLGIDPDKFFAKVVFAGSHENAVTAVAQGTCDLAFNWWNSETDSNLTRMVKKGMVKNEDFKIVFKSDLLAGSPYIYITSMPKELRAAIAKAFIEAPKRAKEAFERLSDGKDLGFHPVTHKDYEAAVALQRFVDGLRRKSTN